MPGSAATFPARFAELVYLLANRADALSERDAVLRAAVDALGGKTASLTTSRLNVDLLDEGETDDGVRLHELAVRMSAHSAHQIDFLAGVPGAEVLGIARILAAEAHPDDDGAAFDEKLVALGATSIEVHLGRNGFVRAGSMTPTGGPRVAAPPVRTPTPFRAVPAFSSRTSPASPSPAPSRAPHPTPPASGPATRSTPIHGGVAVPQSVAPRPLAPNAGGAGQAAAPRYPMPPAPAIGDESMRIIEGAIKTKPLAQLSDDEVIEQLRTKATGQSTMRLLDEVVNMAEARAREQNWEAVTRAFVAVVAGEAAAENDAELRRSHTIALRRLTKPTLIRGIAGLLPRRPDLRDDLYDVLLRLGPDGAEALIDLLTTAEVLTDRRAYLAALAKCRDAVPTLIHLLGDGRWYVVRNAADLLGEMRASEAENALIEVTAHREERVRRSVATALARLATPRAIQSVQQMLEDSVPEVRVHAGQGLGAVKSPRAVSVLSRALDVERDVEVQAVILAALGRQATDEAVARLTRAAEPEGRLFKRKPTAFRVSAVQALAEANTPAALAALRRFADDKDRDVRDAAARALKGRSDGLGPGIPDPGSGVQTE